MDMYNGFKSTIVGFDESVPIILTQLSGDYDAINNTTIPPTYMKKYINDVFTSLVEENDNFSMIRTIDLQFKTDARHFQTKSLRTMGHRMFDEYMKVIKQSNPKPVLNTDVTSIITRSDLYLKPIQTLGWSNKILNHYGRKSVTYSLLAVVGTGGDIASLASVIVDYVRLGSIIFATFKNVQNFTVGTVNTIYETVAGAIPIELRPLEDSSVITMVIYGTSVSECNWLFLPNGTIQLRLSADASGSFDAGITYYVHPCTTIQETSNDSF